MELHVPLPYCDPIDHLMSQCNHRRQTLKCDAASDEEFFSSIKTCFLFLDFRYNNELRKHFDVKCYDFRKQFTTYQDYTSERLHPRRLVSTPFVKRTQTVSETRKVNAFGDVPIYWRKQQIIF
eukprot:scaffold2002_cov53-Attheya_sp.AAC.1